ncbi:hypothetical protein VOLCADRAFT_105238 [Volvox carteri f. nagariensis]|uniref:Prefoldin subunit 2 n=1 Tax=Volvox carteri f. nagariensis TaxID=3068 RepID=D8TZH4_VOLCA|nr:uncharacterized protein VOLCADRAFT_105238 [Volvox carteri f. nagariensis]EFJ47276.1 hypothetical protein VOLCADRAFT_105238 [Volvox carteri f. nagariensis]|eukprot:XP_002951825.1 hypothetical protein VOLCADRAFT_105238 [Volvox carteri f. nagariensis]
MSAGPREQELLSEFQNKRERIQITWGKITELAAEVTEHKLVLEALEKVDKDRKCFRLVGDMLVERTVKETMPAVAKNKENLEATINTLKQQLDAQKKDLNEFQTKHKIRIRTESEVAAEEAAKPKEGSKPGAAQGVLVSKS